MAREPELKKAAHGGRGVCNSGSTTHRKLDVGRDAGLAGDRARAAPTRTSHTASFPRPWEAGSGLDIVVHQARRSLHCVGCSVKRKLFEKMVALLLNMLVILELLHGVLDLRTNTCPCS